MNKNVQIAIVDDHQIFRTGMEVIINGIPNFNITGSFPDGGSLLQGLKISQPDLIFMDIKLPDYSGIDLTRTIKQKYPSVKIIALTMFGEIEYFNKMGDAGADGFLMKNTDIPELEKAIKNVLNGEAYFAKEFLGYLNLKTKSVGQPLVQVHLSEREKEVLKLICDGDSNNEIAEKLFISTHTVDGHRRNLIQKTGVKNTPNLVMFALKNGLIE
ncbi:response regulator [Maribellus maritimus]|uniref:response regulator n=1 Tax=Maribellus maritimus TaxID=2870838 RepID=UPI001EECB699|nr:response regulator transcription factor [Maribellus maritimus]MCG6186231.1 response regulator transcription factor [Maribellus maritimus]